MGSSELPLILGSSTNKSNANGSNELLVVCCEDALVEILCRLPQKPMVRFKCVSKSWCRLINTVCIPRVSLSSAACFLPVAGLYFRTYKPPRGYIIRRSTHGLGIHYEGDELPPDYLDELKSGFYVGVEEELEVNNSENDHSRGRRLSEWGECFPDYGLAFKPSLDEFLDCRNGLLLFGNSASSQYYVCNPVTRQCIPIPAASRHEKHKCFMYAALAFDPSKSPNYRVVRFEHFQTDDVGLDIYSSDTETWVRYSVKLRPYLIDSMMMRYSVYFDGALYRLSSSWHLVRFDLEEVNACMIRLPTAKHEFEGLSGCIGVLMGDLCYANEDSAWLFIWSLGSLKSRNWILKHKIYIPHLTWKLHLPKGPDPARSWFGPCAFNPSRDVIFVSTPGMIMSYDLKARTLTELAKVEDDVIILPGCYYPAIPYVRFLVPFNELGEVDLTSKSYRPHQGRR